MTLAVMALYARAPPPLRNIASWRVKETDRIAAMATELRKLGATVQEGADYIQITPAALSTGKPPASTPTTTTASPCASRWRPSTRPGCRCASKTPNAWPRLSRTTSRPVLGTAVLPAQRIPVICIDGLPLPAGHRGGQPLAKRLGYHFLDSGAMYRITAWPQRRAVW